MFNSSCEWNSDAFAFSKIICIQLDWLSMFNHDFVLLAVDVCNDHKSMVECAFTIAFLANKCHRSFEIAVMRYFYATLTSPLSSEWCQCCFDISMLVFCSVFLSLYLDESKKIFNLYIRSPNFGYYNSINEKCYSFRTKSIKNGKWLNQFL